VKFHCDKCKTRYSIGEDRVRGKILKIRCKNCGNVITVREGMESVPAYAGAAERSTGTTTPAPAALEEEWYVSIDGVQSGPMPLVDAQRWVSQKPVTADLYCWSEGFDDWLSVDKVSHFRNLRKPAAPPPTPARPPIPRMATAAPPPIPAVKREEAKPLFASTMAAIEKEAASGPVRAAAAQAPAPASPFKSTPSGPTPRVNGNGASGSMPAATGKGSGPLAAIPELPRTRTPPGRFPPIKSSAATALALTDAFDSDDADSATQVGVAPPVFDEKTPVPTGSQTPPRGFDFGSMSDPNVKVPAPSTKPAPVPLSALGAPAPKPTLPVSEPKKSVQQVLDDEDDDLSIGEVSRVVNLKDIVPRQRTPSVAPQTSPIPKAASGTAPVPKLGVATGAHPRFAQTASQTKFSPTDLGMNVDPSLLSKDGPLPDESLVAQTFRQKHRRGMMALIGFAAALVAGVIILVVVLTGNDSDNFAGRLGDTRVIDTSRPEDIVKRQLPPTPDTGSAGSATTKTVIKYLPRPNGNSGGPTEEDDPKGDSLRASEIEDMAAKQGEGTKRCYMRAQKGAIGFEIAELKKIAVTLTVGKDGTVSSVDLSSHGNDSFGQCLIARIKSWRFRESPGGGTFRISLAFSNG
jgi:predicted Zn finger-like uncharacterized protein